jgi:hypothetical protein
MHDDTPFAHELEARRKFEKDWEVFTQRASRPEPERETYEVAQLVDFGARGYSRHVIGNGDKWDDLGTQDTDNAILAMLNDGWMMVSAVSGNSLGAYYYFQRKAVSK